MADFERKMLMLAERGTPIGPDALIERVEQALADSRLAETDGYLADRPARRVAPAAPSVRRGFALAMGVFLAVVAVGALLFYLTQTGSGEFVDTVPPTEITTTTSVTSTTIDAAPVLPRATPAGDVAFFEEAVRFAKQYDIAICHDAPYTEVAYDGYKPISFMQAEGARDVGIEFHSLSKSFNMTGWRVGMAVGNATLIDALFRIKSNVDSGINQAVQRMAIAALDGPQDCIEDHNQIYQHRRDVLVEALRACGLRVNEPKASLYLWAKVPDGFTATELAARLIDDIGVVVTPGNAFGPSGEGFVRLSITTPTERVEAGAKRLLEWAKQNT